MKKKKKEYLTPIVDEKKHKVYDKTHGRTPKYNYVKMKLEYFEGPWKAVAPFLREKYNLSEKEINFMRHMTIGWVDEKVVFLKKALKLANKKFLSEMVEDEKQVLIRQQKIGKLLQSKGIKSLKDVSPKNLEEVRRLISTGTDIELKALGLDQKRKAPSNLTQVNVNLPKTRFDKILDGLDYGGILKLIAEVRREKTRRAGNPPIIEGSTES